MFLKFRIQETDFFIAEKTINDIRVAEGKVYISTTADEFDFAKLEPETVAAFRKSLEEFFAECSNAVDPSYSFLAHRIVELNETLIKTLPDITLSPLKVGVVGRHPGEQDNES